jgi:hypothetical protein
MNIQSLVEYNVHIHVDDPRGTVINEFLVSTAWRILWLRMEEMSSRYGG